MQKIFEVPSPYEPVAISQDGSQAYVAANSPAGCTVFWYCALTDKPTSKLLQHYKCTSIASDSKGFYIGNLTTNEVWFWTDWNVRGGEALPQWPNINGIDVLHFDSIGDRLLLADSAVGARYTISPPDFKRIRLAEDLGHIYSLALSDSQVLVGFRSEGVVLGSHN